MTHKFTAPLLAAPDGLPVYSDGYRLVELTHAYTNLTLDPWQADLIVRVLERCPPGHEREGQLRYRQVVVSIPRQAGKSVIASVLALYALLMHSETPKVLGVARNAKQAALVYDYTRGHIAASPDVLGNVLKARGTPGLGISKRDGSGSYVVLAGDSDALQGYPSTLAIVDELHIVKPDVYDAIVTSQRAQTNPLLVGISTAGDIDSVLLKRLYQTGEAALAGERETFGFFVWEASGTEFTLEAIIEANPAVACGRISAQTIYDDEKDSPPANWMRYALNRFVDGLAEPWLPIEAWAKCAGNGLMDYADCVYSIEIHGNYEYATVYAAKKVDGVVYTSLVARLYKPSQERLQEFCVELRKAGRCTFTMDGYRKTKTLANFLDEKGYAVVRIGAGGSRVEAAAMTYAAVMRQEVQHDSQPAVDKHHATAVMKRDVLDGKEIDMAYATVYAVYVALNQKKRGRLVA